LSPTDAGALISLGLVKHIFLLEKVIDSFYIANAVWLELLAYETPEFEKRSFSHLEKRERKIKLRNHLTAIMDYGEAESVILYEELKADYLLIKGSNARD